MKLFVEASARKTAWALAVLWGVFFLLAEGLFWQGSGRFSVGLLGLFLLAAGAMGAVCLVYLRRQEQLFEQAAAKIKAYLAGDRSARIPCDEEGEVYRLFHEVNALAAVLNAHAENELCEKEFLKNTISDISHQLKTPLAALNIYNGLLQEESIDPASVKEFAALSEQELDRMETLVQDLLKMARLDAGAIQLEPAPEKAADLMRDIALHFACRAKQEQKELTLSGAEDVTLCCDREWLGEAVGNLVKNALDHTGPGDTVQLQWRALPTVVQICVKDNGSGIHPEDLPHLFKRFYRSRFAQDTQGVGLGLPLAKSIVEAHGGTIEVDSELGRGTAFTLDFPIATKL